MREWAQRLARGWLGEDLCDRGFLEGSFDHGQGVVQAFVEWAKADAMRVQLQRTAANALKGFYGLDHIPDGQFFRGLGKGETAVQAALGMDEAGAMQTLHHLGQISGRHLGDRGDLLGGSRLVLGGKKDHGPQGIFDGLRKHEALTFL
jgi:hypothetical protein